MLIYCTKYSINNNNNMQHFANFKFGQILGQAKSLGREGLAAAKHAAQMRGTQIGAGVGAVGGLVAGAGAAESDEERANTTALGRAGKLLNGAAVGGLAGGYIGGGIQASGLPQKAGRYTRKKMDDVTKQPVQGELF